MIDSNQIHVIFFLKYVSRIHPTTVHTQLLVIAGWLHLSLIIYALKYCFYKPYQESKTGAYIEIYLFNTHFFIFT